MMKKLTQLFAGLVLLSGLCFGLVAPTYAAPDPGPSAATPTDQTDYKQPNYVVDCPQGYTPIPDNPNDPGNSDSHACCPTSVVDKAGGVTKVKSLDCLMAKYTDPAIQVLGALVGVFVVIGIILGAIQYASSAGDPQKASAGKGKILKAMYALIAFLFLYAALQFLSPGGLSNKTYSNPTARTCAQGNTFLTLKPWYAYLPTTDSQGNRTFGPNCQVQNFDLLPSNGSPSMVPAVILAIVDDLLRIIGLIAVAFVIVGGIQYVTSQGEPDRTKRAQETIINALIGLVVAIVAASFVAYIGTKLSTGTQTGTTANGLPQLTAGNRAIQNVLDIVFAIVGTVSFLMIVIGGLRYVLAGGDPGKMSQAKKAIIYALIGLVVVLSAYGIVTLVVRGIS